MADKKRDVDKLSDAAHAASARAKTMDDHRAAMAAHVEASKAAEASDRPSLAKAHDAQALKHADQISQIDRSRQNLKLRARDLARQLGRIPDGQEQDRAALRHELSQVEAKLSDGGGDDDHPRDEHGRFTSK